MLYADETTEAMESAIEETRRRRRIQREFNEAHDVEPSTIEKAVGEIDLPGSKTDTSSITGEGPSDAGEAADLVAELEDRMAEAADNLEFELAADIRDRIRELVQEFDLEGGIDPADDEDTSSMERGIEPEPDGEW